MPVTLEGIYINAKCSWTLEGDELLIALSKRKRRILLSDIREVTFQEPQGVLTDGVIALTPRQEEVDAEEEEGRTMGGYMRAFLRTPSVSADSDLLSIRFKRRQSTEARAVYEALRERISGGE